MQRALALAGCAALRSASARASLAPALARGLADKAADAASAAASDAAQDAAAGGKDGACRAAAWRHRAPALTWHRAGPRDKKALRSRAQAAVADGTVLRLRNVPRYALRHELATLLTSARPCLLREGRARCAQQS